MYFFEPGIPGRQVVGAPVHRIHAIFLKCNKVDAGRAGHPLPGSTSGLWRGSQFFRPACLTDATRHGRFLL